MTTVTMNISMPDTLRDFVESRVKARGYTSASEYMRELVRRDEERAAHDQFYTAIEAGVNSGICAESWADQRQRLAGEIVSRAKAVA